VKLRHRFVLSHTLPVLIIVPLTGIVLIYVLQVLVLVPRVSEEIRSASRILASLAQETPALWDDPEGAQRFVDRYSGGASWTLMLLDSRGRLVATSDPSGRLPLGSVPASLSLEVALEGEEQTITRSSLDFQSEIVETYSPVFDTDGIFRGILRVSQPLSGVAAEFARMRAWVIGILLSGLAVGVAIGLGLAVNLERPLKGVTQAIQHLAEGERLPLETRAGPEEIRVLAQSFNSLVDRLKTLEATRRRLLANLVHELGQHLGAIRSAILALTQGADQDPSLRKEFLTGVDLQTKGLERLLEDLTRLYDTTTGRLEIRRARTDLRAWLLDRLGPWAAAAQQKGLAWQVEVAELPMLWIDPIRLDQALGNLLSNSIKFTPVGGGVKVRGVLGEAEIVIAVEDTGPGVAPEDRANLFTPFYRGRQGSRFPQGMGLGLSIAHDLVEAHGGRLTFETPPAGGVCFEIHLPLPS
jgi:signal transduction histidine kinase